MITIKELLLLLILGHILGDFYFQTSTMAKKKKEQFSWVIYHGLEYLVVLVLVILPVYSSELLMVAIILGIFHFVIDSLKFVYLNKRVTAEYNNESNDGILFFIDQFIHLSFILFTAIFVFQRGIELQPVDIVDKWINLLGFSGINALIIVVSLLLIWRPCSFFVKNFFLVIGVKKIKLISRK